MFGAGGVGSAPGPKRFGVQGLGLKCGVQGVSGSRVYRGTSLIRNIHPPRLTIGASRHRATAGSCGVCISYERATPVKFGVEGCLGQGLGSKVWGPQGNLGQGLGSNIWVFGV